jgi:hypothetical protein
MLEICADRFANFRHELGNRCPETWSDNIDWTARICSAII